MEDGEEETGAGDVMDDEEIARKIELETKEALRQMEDGGVLVALETLRSLVEEQSGVTETPPATVEVCGQLHRAMREMEEITNPTGKEAQPLPYVPPAAPEPIDLDEVIEMCLKKMKPTVQQSLKLPWEVGFAGMVLNGNTGFYGNEVLQNKNLHPRGVVPKIPDEVIAEEEKKKPEMEPTFRFPARGGTKPWKVAEDERREKAVKRWLVILRTMGSSSPVTAMVEQSGEEVMEDVFAKKKTGTLEVRSSAILLYIRWCHSKGFDPFPINEELCYIYVDELRKNNAPATRANSFISALAFCKGTFMVGGVDEVLQSSRVSGSAHRSYLTKRLLRRRDALTVDQVGILEHLVVSEASNQDRLFAGHCLLCVYGRLRFGDSQCIEEEPEVDDEYVECGMTMHKTSNLAGRARRVLPVVAPAMGVTGTEWGREYLSLRAAEGLRGWPGLPFFPCPILGGGWSRARLSTTEASMWLCELLHRCGVPKEKLTNVGAHSLKATCLSWMSKAGMEVKTRRLMGYHVKPKDTSVLLYSRDALAPGLEGLRGLIYDIFSGKFRPDVSRSGRWIKKPVVIDAEEYDQTVVDLEEPESEDVLDVGVAQTVTVKNGPLERIADIADQSSESEESQASSGDTEDERNVEAVVTSLIGPPKRATAVLYRHNLTGKIHKGSTVDGKLACGRQISALMSELQEPAHAIDSMCKVCAGYQRDH